MAFRWIKITAWRLDGKGDGIVLLWDRGSGVAFFHVVDAEFEEFLVTIISMSRQEL